MKGVTDTTPSDVCILQTLMPVQNYHTNVMESKGTGSAKIEVIHFHMQINISGEGGEQPKTLFIHPAQLESLKSE